MSLPSRTKRNRNAPSIASRSCAGSPHAANKRSPEVRRGRGQLGLVFGQRQRRLKRPLLEGRDERGRIQTVAYVVARRAQSLDDGDSARRRIEADRIAGAAAPRRIIRQHASKPLVRRRLAAKARPAASKLGDELDAVGERPMPDRGEFGPGVARARRLEGNGAGENASVDFRQRDMHRKIRRPEPALRGAPGVEAHAREHDLQDRRVERVERGSLFSVQPGGEGGGVEHDVEALPFETSAQRLKRRLVLEAGDEHGFDRKALVAQRARQRLDGLEIAREIDGAIEDDEGARRVRLSLEAGLVEAAEGADGNGRRSVCARRRSERRERRGTPPCCRGRPRRNSARCAGPRRCRASRPRRGARRGAGPPAAAPA